MNRLNTPRSPAVLPALVAGAAPLPGYYLIEPIGRGGFGEVWKCEVSGGLFKAIKFVRDSGATGHRSAAAQELEALQWIKGIRHPFLLSIERIELIGGTLILVMELADQNLLNLHQTAVKQGQPGIQRAVLLSLLREVAEVLDLMNVQYGLQHLDIKPHNIFLVGTHAKVGDFGLVSGLTGGGSSTSQGGITPLDAAPERLKNTWSRTTDQYSLAIVYQQMLTGVTPYQAPTAQQLAQLHLSGEPNLTSLPPQDRPIIARALSRDPEQRFPTCTALIDALVGSERLPSPAAILQASGIESGLHPRPIAARPSVNTTTPRPGSAQPASREVTATGSPSAGPPVAPTRIVQTELQQSSPLEFLPGYQLVECLEQTALRDLWQVRTPEGEERLAHWLLQPIDPPVELIAHLEQLQHPSLVRTEVLVSPTRRLVLLSPIPGETLADRFAQAQAEGLPGIGREMLLRWLYPIAEALDWLHTEGETLHLGLTMESIVLRGRDAELREAGLIPLVWLPQQKTAGDLNPRYSAPEAYTVDGPQPASDQYSLALLYAEAATGVPPRRGRGQRLDLDLLPASERPVLARALDEDPAQRFPTCLELLDALIAAGQDSQTFIDFPPVVRLGVLQGTRELSEEYLPNREELVATLHRDVSALGRTHQTGTATYIILPDGVWECRYPIQFLLSTLPLKLEGFRDQWKGRPISTPEPDTHIIHLIVSMPRTSYFQWKTPEGGIEIVVRLHPTGPQESRSREVCIQLRPIGDNLPEAQKLLEKQGPRLIQSLRTYIHPAPEQRTQQRFPFDYPVIVWNQTEAGWQAYRAHGVDLSLGGIRITLKEPLVNDLVYLEFPGWKALKGLALRGLVRREIENDDALEYGISFD